MRLDGAVRLLARELEEANVAFAVVGGLAASARGEVRFTRDVDIAVVVESDAEAEALIHRLIQRGYAVSATAEQEATARLATVRLRDPAGIVCDLVFATSGIEFEVVETATKLELFPETIVPTASVEALLAMKVLSVTDQRSRDRDDLRGLIAENRDFDRARVEDLLRRIEARGYSRGQDLPAKWREVLATLGGRY